MCLLIVLIFAFFSFVLHVFADVVCLEWFCCVVYVFWVDCLVRLFGLYGDCGWLYSLVLLVVAVSVCLVLGLRL